MPPEMGVLIWKKKTKDHNDQDGKDEDPTELPFHVLTPQYVVKRCPSEIGPYPSGSHHLLDSLRGRCGRIRSILPLEDSAFSARSFSLDLLYSLLSTTPGRAERRGKESSGRSRQACEQPAGLENDLALFYDFFPVHGCRGVIDDHIPVDLAERLPTYVKVLPESHVDRPPNFAVFP